MKTLILLYNDYYKEDFIQYIFQNKVPEENKGLSSKIESSKNRHLRGE
jgi:hypothetical protein